MALPSAEGCRDDQVAWGGHHPEVPPPTPQLVVNTARRVKNRAWASRLGSATARARPVMCLLQ